MKFLKKHYISLLAVMLICSLGILVILVVTPVSDRARTESIEVPRGASLSQVAGLLRDAGLIRSRGAFIILGRLKSASQHIRAGEYEFNTSMPSTVILNKLVRGEIKGYAVVVPEGFTMEQVADAIIDARLPKGKAFLKAATDRELLAGLNVPARSAEGYLFPDTYNFTRSMSEKDMVTIMVNEFWKKVTPELIEEARQTGLGLHKIIVLASLIEKEAMMKEEKPLVSAVFHNRLRKGMRLQCDPTVVYGVEGFDGTIMKSHLLSRKNPYNTYVYYGLPPGPIANPGLDSIIAAIRPAPVNYLYFVSRNDGSHQFSSTLAGHNVAVAKFRLNRDKE